MRRRPHHRPRWRRTTEQAPEMRIERDGSDRGRGADREAWATRHGRGGNLGLAKTGLDGQQQPRI
jgi:hypothetical protein